MATDYLTGEPAGSIRLSVPYISQEGEGARRYGNDCGAACGAMLVGAYLGELVTPDTFYAQSGYQGGTGLYWFHIRNVLQEHYYIPTKWIDSGLTLDDVWALMRAGRPIIANFRYGHLREKVTTWSRYTDLHWAVIVGIDQEYVYLNDPLWDTTDPGFAGEHLPVRHADWMQVWDSQYRAALVPTLGLPRFSLRWVNARDARVTWPTGLMVRSEAREGARPAYHTHGDSAGYPKTAEPGAHLKIFATRDDLASGNRYGAITIDYTEWVAVQIGDAPAVEFI